MLRWHMHGAARAWVYSAEFTIDRLSQGGYVTIRDGQTGFDNRIPVILSGEGGILNNVTEFDTSIAILQ